MAKTDAQLANIIGGAGGRLDGLGTTIYGAGGNISDVLRAVGMLGGYVGRGYEPDGTLPIGEGTPELNPGGAPGYGDFNPNPVPPPSEGGGDPFVPPAGGNTNTSWDWSKFGGGGGAPQDAPPFLGNYTPGEDATWGVPGVEGNNRDFYQNQFNNLNAQQQAFQQNSMAAALRRQQAANQPQQGLNTSWDWANQGQGIDPAVASTGQNWQLNPRYGESPTNEQIIREYIRSFPGTTDDEGNAVASEQGGWWQARLDAMTPEQLQSTHWGAVGDPNKLIKGLGPVAEGSSGDNYQRYVTLFNSLYQPGQGSSSVPAGYAAPV